MDTDSEITKFKLMLFAIVVFIASGFMAYNELRYLAFAKWADANLLQIEERTKRGRYGTTSVVLAVQYEFRDTDGTSRKEEDTVGTSWPIPESATTPVEFLSGVKGKSRLKGNNRFWTVWLFFGSLILMATGIYRLAQMANEPIRRSGRRSS